MREDAAGLGDEPAEPGEHRRQAGVERAHDEHVAGRRRRVRAEVDRSGTAATACAPATLPAPGADRHDDAVHGQAERRRERWSRLEAVPQVEHERPTGLDELGELVQMQGATRPSEPSARRARRAAGRAPARLAPSAPGPSGCEGAGTPAPTPHHRPRRDRPAARRGAAGRVSGSSMDGGTRLSSTGCRATSSSSVPSG